VPTPARRATTGAIAALVGLSTGNLLTTVWSDGHSPVSAVGDQLISLAPAAVREFAIERLGTHDKPVIIGLVVLAWGVVGALAGLAASLSRRRLMGALLALTSAEVAATVVAAPQSVVSGIAIGVAAAGAALAVIAALTRSVAAGHTDALRAGVGTPASRRGYSRRQFVAAAVTMVGGAMFMTQVAMSITRGMLDSVESVRRRIRLPRVAAPLPPVATAATLDVPGISPLVTPNTDFYRIDIALQVPRVDVTTWRLTIHGMVNHPFTLSFDDLLAMPQVEADITLCCVSDEVGGNLLGNARWQGVRLADLLTRAGVQHGGNQVVGRSVDGFTVGFPTVAALDGRDALVAIGMNGEPLPIEHGFPARLIVPGLYGYVSATKWLSEIELTTFDRFSAFWIDRGWALPAPIRTESRIDVPGDGGLVAAGDSVIAGVAWAQHRGIKDVEVRVDGGAWQQAELADALGIDTWRQWRLRWAATAGRHTIEVRATDATGEVQTQQRAEPYPAGATGYHSVSVTVA